MIDTGSNCTLPPKRFRVGADVSWRLWGLGVQLDMKLPEVVVEIGPFVFFAGWTRY